MVIELIEKVGRALDDRGIPYMIIGGQAVLIYGKLRVTRDVDITLGVTIERLDDLISIVANLGLKPLPSDVDNFVRANWTLPVEDSGGLRFDFIFSWTDYESQAMQRVNCLVLNTYPIRFASREDVVIHKLFAGRERDIEDVRGILLKQATLDIEYVQHWLRLLEEGSDRRLLEQFESTLKST